MNKQYHIYETTNLVNGKKYRGAHNTIGDNYLGSGLKLKEAIEKYGKENFKKEILEIFTTEDEMYEAERDRYVTEEWVNRKDTYNLAVGGHGGKIQSEETKKKMSLNKKEYYANGKNRDEIEQLIIRNKTNNPIHDKNNQLKQIDSLLKHYASEEGQITKQTISDSLKEWYKTPEGIKRKEEIKLEQKIIGNFSSNNPMKKNENKYKQSIKMANNNPMSNSQSKNKWKDSNKGKRWMHNDFLRKNRCSKILEAPWKLGRKVY